MRHSQHDACNLYKNHHHHSNIISKILLKIPIKLRSIFPKLQSKKNPTCVRLDVAVQGGFHSKSLPAFVTLVGSFSCMDPNVPTNSKGYVSQKSKLCAVLLYATSVFPIIVWHSGLCKLLSVWPSDGGVEEKVIASKGRELSINVHILRVGLGNQKSILGTSTGQ